MKQRSSETPGDELMPFPPSGASEQTLRLGGLDILRGFAAAEVMLFHLTFFSWAPPIGINHAIVSAPRFPELVRFFASGWVGVEIFFVISGFVITNSAQGRNYRGFLRSRIGRLLPGVLLCAPITLFILLAFRLVPPSNAIRLYLNTVLFYPKGPWVSGVYWTLTLEVTFYALVILVLFVKQFHRIEFFAAILGLFSTVYIFGRTAGYLPTLSAHTLAQHGCFFSIGIFIWLIAAKGYTMCRCLLVALFTLAGNLEICFLAHGQLELDQGLIATILWLVSCGVIVGCALFPYSGNWLTIRAGLMTYPLYLIHDEFGSVLLRTSKWIGRYEALVLSVIIVLACSWLLTELEPSVRRLILRMFDVIFSALERALKFSSLRPRSSALCGPVRGKDD
jgi:peptidoglycan/LPS O-acetylase OafA/YrhL